MNDTSNIDRLLAALDEMRWNETDEVYDGGKSIQTYRMFNAPHPHKENPALIAKEVIEVFRNGVNALSDVLEKGEDLDIELNEILSEANAIAAKLEEKRG